MTIHLKGPFTATPSPTSLPRRIDFRVGIFSDAPPEEAVFEYTSHRQDVYFEEGGPVTRTELVEAGEEAPMEIHHRYYLDSMPGTEPAEAPVSLVVTGPGGESHRCKSVIALKRRRHR